MHPQRDTDLAELERDAQSRSYENYLVRRRYLPPDVKGFCDGYWSAMPDPYAESGLIRGPFVDHQLLADDDYCTRFADGFVAGQRRRCGVVVWLAERLAWRNRAYSLLQEVACCNRPVVKYASNGHVAHQRPAAVLELIADK